jgi:protein gp37
MFRGLAVRIPFFFKPWGGASKKQAGRLLEGRLWNQMLHSAWAAV